MPCRLCWTGLGHVGCSKLPEMLEIYLKISEISPKNPNPLCIEENARKKKLHGTKPGTSGFLFLMVSSDFGTLRQKRNFSRTENLANQVQSMR